MTYQPNFKVARIRSRPHMAYVGTLACLLCGIEGVQVHHLTCGPEPKARGMKASDSQTLPLCMRHHDALHHEGNERRFWQGFGLDPIAIAADLWGNSLAAGRA